MPLLILFLLILLLVLRVPVAFALGGLGAALLAYYPLPLNAIPQRLYGAMDSFELLAVPEMTSRGYPKHFVYGLIAAGGTLGIMIPPSIPLIIYGVISESSITKLFLAGIGPGIFLIFLFISYSIIYSKVSKKYTKLPKATWQERFEASLRSIPTMIIAISVIGSIYAGIATPSESAGLGFVISLIMTFAMRRMNIAKLKEAVYDSAKTTIMLFMIIAGAKVFSYAITLYMIPQNISNHTLFILAIGIVLLFIRFFLESLSILLIMVPVLFPAVIARGIDPIWFGLFFVILIEMALITPPIGMNLFIIQGISHAKIETAIKGVWPFVLMMAFTAVLLWFWQGLALYIPYHF